MVRILEQHICPSKLSHDGWPDQVQSGYNKDHVRLKIESACMLQVGVVDVVLHAVTSLLMSSPKRFSNFAQYGLLARLVGP